MLMLNCCFKFNIATQLILIILVASINRLPEYHFITMTSSLNPSKATFSHSYYGYRLQHLLQVFIDKIQRFIW
jgi:hypothetical protein